MLRKTIIFIISIVVLFSACTSVKKTIESGNYDKAIDLAIAKLKGKKHKKEANVKGLELALAKANTRDLNTIEHLVAEQNPKHWERINNLYQDIQDRQAKINPLLPLVAKGGYTAKFNFVDVASLERESRQKAAEYVHTYALELLQKGEKGDRLAARDAYNQLKKLKTFDTYFADTEEAIAKAKNYGTTRILVEMRNQSNVILPRDFDYRMMHLAKQELQSPWLDYFFDEKNTQKFDYKVVIKLNNIDVSPERVNTREYTDEAKVEDGWDYVLDNKGNVKKDSLGKDIKTKHYTIVKAYVREVYQTKAAKVGGDIEIYDFTTQALLDKDRITTEVTFNHYASTFNGDRRALCAESSRKIGNRPAPFPSNNDMLNDAADKLKPLLRDRLRDSRMIL